MASSLGHHHAALVAAVVVMITLMGGGVGTCGAEGVDHKVGNDQGWDAGTNIAAWSADRVFRVGDYLWFAYSAVQDGITELGSREEFEACDLSSPIGLYTGGLHKVALDEEGARYFASSKTDECRNGLKLHVRVLPLDAEPAIKQVTEPAITTEAVAAGPKPSGSPIVRAASPLVWSSLAMLYLVSLQMV